MHYLLIVVLVKVFYGYSFCVLFYKHNFTHVNALEVNCNLLT